MKRPRVIVRNVSLARALSKLGFSSRSQAAVLIKEGKVTVNGKQSLDPDLRCSLEHDKIAVDGKRLREEEKQKVYVVLNKPVGYVTTRDDERGRSTIYDLIAGLNTWVYPVGRLDKDTSGLIILTNDHQLGETLTNPQSKVPKRYTVVIDHPLTAADRKAMETGMMLDDTKLLPAQITTVAGSEGLRVEITIVEGKNRQIRRMFGALGYIVSELSRTSIGTLTLGNLKPGQWRHLSEGEVAVLREPARPSPRSPLPRERGRHS